MVFLLHDGTKTNKISFRSIGLEKTINDESCVHSSSRGIWLEFLEIYATAGNVHSVMNTVEHQVNVQYLGLPAADAAGNPQYKRCGP